nr:MAG TPA: hypothetical protein [Caudoviricetes sp.]
MLKNKKNVTENEKKSMFFIVHFGLITHIKKVRPAARSFKASLTHILVCGPAYITTLSLTNRGRFMRYAKQRKDKRQTRIVPGESIQVDSGL